VGLGQVDPAPADLARLVDPDASTIDHHVAVPALAPMVPRGRVLHGNQETVEPVFRRRLRESSGGTRS
jgi:hypothetical protein